MHASHSTSVRSNNSTRTRLRGHFHTFLVCTCILISSMSCHNGFRALNLLLHKLHSNKLYVSLLILVLAKKCVKYQQKGLKDVVEKEIMLSHRHIGSWSNITASIAFSTLPSPKPFGTLINFKCLFRLILAKKIQIFHGFFMFFFM